MASSLLLVVEDDPRVRGMVASTLQEKGYEVETASNGQEALECVSRRMPDLIVSDIMMPRMDGWSFVRRFRSMPGSALVPVVFLTSLGSEEHRMYGFKLGADEYITKPFKNKELVQRIHAALERRRQFQSAVSGATPAAPIALSPGIRGTLDQMGLASLLSILEMEYRTGRLVVRSPKKQTAVVHVRDGRMIRVRFKHLPDLTGAEAAYELLTWGEGHFEFRPMPVDEEDEINSTAPALLLEAARRLDEENASAEEA